MKKSFISKRQIFPTYNLEITHEVISLHTHVEFFYEKTQIKERMGNLYSRILKQWIIQICLVSKTELTGSSVILLVEKVIT